MYNSIDALSTNVYRLQSYYHAAVGGYDEEYVCEALPATELADAGRRIYRVRYVATTTTVFDKCYAVGDDTAKFDNAIGTARFMFPATDLATVEALTFNDA